MGNVLANVEFDKAQASAKANGTELREAPRFTLLIRAAKLIMPHGEFLCVIRDASDTGLSARVFHPLPRSGEIIVELQNGKRYAAEMVWQNDDRAGFRFAEPVDVSTIIECPSHFAKRPVRINVSTPAQIVAASRDQAVVIHDISQQGAKIACLDTYAIDERVKLRAQGMRDTQAKVRWRRKGTCGLVFEETFQYGELARIARSLQEQS